jgi:hypothetical protein
MDLYICQEIMKIDDLPTVIGLFRKLVKSKECVHDRAGLYRQI